MSDHSRAVLFSLIRTLRPAVVAEIATMYAGTAEVIARALWENGQGQLYTTDPLGGERCPAIIAAWPLELRNITHFRPLNSMDLLFQLSREFVMLDLVLVDGNHDFEFAMFDLQMAARLLRPGGVIVMDNAEQSGPLKAPRDFMSANPEWREIGDALTTYDPARPFDGSRASAPGTSFIILQAPSHLPIGEGPHSSGQISTKGFRIDGLSFELPAQAAVGTLHYQVILRAFRDNGDIPEVKTVGRLPLRLTGEPMTTVHEFDTPLRLDYADAQFTYEIDLSWQPDSEAPSLALTRMPTPVPMAPILPARF